MNTKITFYPVGNGDCNLVEFANGAKMMIDCNFRVKSENENSDDYDVIGDLLNNKLTTKRHGLPFLPAFVLTHPDQDHCRGFLDKFFLEKNPEQKEPTQQEKDDKLILIGELWYSPRVFTESQQELNKDAKAFKKEAERRMELYKTGSADANKDGNRIRIIGYADVDQLDGIPADRISAAGSKIKEINGKKYSDMSIFVHAPFKNSIEGENRNETSIVLQIRVDVNGKTDKGRIIFGGDAEWRVWEKIMDKTSDDNNLKWNIFEAPHHCSYTYFCDNRDEEPSQSSLDFLDKKDGKGYIVSSSKTIKKNSDNPPCQKAKNRYLEHLDSEDYFRCTTVDEVEKPVVFEVKEDGIHLNSETHKNETKSNSGSRPHVYGEIF
ncbi:MAG TPA: hypothetical protein DCS83_10660 [Prevotella sp.]|nr:hypothetical protein [Prevotella sp.]